MTPIRPNAFPVQPNPPQGADAARQAAQRAFFDAAMGRAGPVPAPAAASLAPAVVAVGRPEVRPQPDAPQPAKLLRPGSLLDIRV